MARLQRRARCTPRAPRGLWREARLCAPPSRDRRVRAAPRRTVRVQVGIGFIIATSFRNPPIESRKRCGEKRTMRSKFKDLGHQEGQNGLVAWATELPTKGACRVLDDAHGVLDAHQCERSVAR